MSNQYVPGPNFSGKISQDHATEFTPGHAGNIDRDAERPIATVFVAIPRVIFFPASIIDSALNLISCDLQCTN